MVQDRVRASSRRLVPRWAKELDWQAALNKSPEERVEHLRATADFIRDREKWELHGWLHQNLTILDGKAGTAFQVNATALALLTFFITGQETELSIAIKTALVVPFAFLLWSTIQLSRIAFVYWSTTADFRDPDHMLDELLRVRDERSRIVRTSWLRAVASLVFVAGIVAADLFF